jgi:hypothetical protein
LICQAILDHHEGLLQDPAKNLFRFTKISEYSVKPRIMHKVQSFLLLILNKFDARDRHKAIADRNSSSFDHK